MQAKALGASLLLCGAFAAGGVMLWRVLGVQTKSETEVSSFHNAVELLRQQRVRTSWWAARGDRPGNSTNLVASHMPHQSTFHCMTSTVTSPFVSIIHGNASCRRSSGMSSGTNCLVKATAPPKGVPLAEPRRSLPDTERKL